MGRLEEEREKGYEGEWGRGEKGVVGTLKTFNEDHTESE